MGTVNANILPATTGLTIGNQNQKWLAYLSNAFADMVISNVLPPAQSGFMRLASTDFIAWRNNANTGDVTISKTGAASTTTPADTIQIAGAGGIGGPFISHNSNPAAAGEVRLAAADTINWRNAANSADITAISKNGSDQIVIPNALLSTPTLNTPVINNATLNNLTIGSLASLTVIPPSPVFTNAQMSDYIVSEVGLTPAEYHTVQVGNYATDAITGCVNLPNGAAVHQVNGVMGLATNSGGTDLTGGAVGVYGQGRILANNVSGWGINDLIQDSVGLTGHQMIANEVDVNILATPARAWGVLVTGASSGTVPALGSAAGVEVRSPGYALGNSLQWPASFNAIDNSGVIGLNVGTTTNANSVGSMPIKLNGRDAGAGAHSVSIACDLNGRLQVNSINTPIQTAVVDLTAQAAAITTTTLYAVPSIGAGVYRLSWSAKVTTVDGVSSTLGALTIVYTDPDGVAQTITAGALTSAGAIATTSTTNTTAAVLIGVPLTLNCKATTNITYAMAYASNTPGTMKYNLHIRLESL